MTPPKPDSDWRIEDEDDAQFVLEDDDTFGVGGIEDGESALHLTADRFAPANEGASAPALTAPPPPEFDDAPGPTVTVSPAGSVNARLTEQPVPRISIHACCDRQDVADLIGGLAADRRLARAEISVETGGIDAALMRFSSQASPNLLILDTTAHAHAMLSGLDRLAQVIEEGTKVVILGAVNDIGLFRELMSRGVSEYVVPPFQATDLIRAICSLYVNPEKPFSGRVVSVIGARGGVGASTIAHNLAWSIAERQELGATLLDLDLSFGTAALDFNQDPQQSIADALSSPERVDDTFLERVTTKHTQRLQMLTAPATLEREFDLDPSAFETVIERVRRTSPYVVLDLPHTWSSWIKQTLLASDDVVIVASPDLASLRNAKNIHDLLKALRPYDGAPSVVLNMVGVPKKPEIPFKDFAEALGATPAASFAFDPALFGMAANNGQMVSEVAPLNKIAVEIDTLAASLTGKKPAEVKRSGLPLKIPFLKR